MDRSETMLARENARVGGTLGLPGTFESPSWVTRPTVVSPQMATNSETENDASLPSSGTPPQRIDPPVPVQSMRYGVDADSTPLQIWEGTVLSVKRETNEMEVNLDPKMGEIGRHTMDISLNWVGDQDKDLVRPGAVFYLTVFKRTKRSGIENSQEVRFRRRPAWSAKQIKEIDEAAAKLLENIATPRIST
jgi:hypothetical protein